MLDLPNFHVALPQCRIHSHRGELLATTSGVVNCDFWPASGLPNPTWAREVMRGKFRPLFAPNFSTIGDESEYRLTMQDRRERRLTRDARRPREVPQPEAFKPHRVTA